MMNEVKMFKKKKKQTNKKNQNNNKNKNKPKTQTFMLREATDTCGGLCLLAGSPETFHFVPTKAMQDSATPNYLLHWFF